MKAKIRESNIELYRIFLMLTIIAHHYVVNSDLINVMYNEPFSIRSIFLFIFGAWGKIGINCFVLITGYYMCKSKITLKKFLKLLLEIEFYRVIVYIIFLITGNQTISIKSIVKAVLPVTSISDNFIGCYIVFYLFIPFINRLIKNINEKEHLIIIGISLFALSIIGNVPGFAVKFNYVTWFIVIYFIGAYLRLYPKKIFGNRKLISILAIIVTLLCIISIIVCLYIGTKINTQMAYFFVVDSNKILAVCTSVIWFLFFKNLKLKYHPAINVTASSILGVLLIHANSDTMREFLWKKTLNNTEAYNTPYIYLHSVLSVIGIFILCVIIDQLRIKIFEKTFFKKFENKIDQIEDKFKNKLLKQNN